MAVLVRPAHVGDRAAPRLLYISAAPYYAAFAGSEEHAQRLLEHMWVRPGHTAGADACSVATDAGTVVGVLAAFPAVTADALARRFLRLAVPRLPVRRWPAVLRHLHASARMTPMPPIDTLYVDALAVAEGARRRGIATRLLEEAARQAVEAGLHGVALDTGLENTGAQRLYETAGFQRRAEHRAPDERTARLVGGPGFVSYLRRV